MAELVYAPSWGGGAGNGVRVQVPLLAQIFKDSLSKFIGLQTKIRLFSVLADDRKLQIFNNYNFYFQENWLLEKLWFKLINNSERAATNVQLSWLLELKEIYLQL